MSQYSSINYKQIIQQQQEQLAALWMQLQALQQKEVKGETSTKAARLQVFDGTSSKVSGFVTAYRLYIRIKMREVVVEE